MDNSSKQRTSRLGVCSWSIGATTESELAHAVHDGIAVSGIQIALDALLDGPWTSDGLIQHLEASSIELLSGMMQPVGEDYTTPQSIRRTGGFAPSETWPENERRASELAPMARDLGLSLVTLHAGAFTRDDGSLDAGVVGRLDRVVEIFSSRGVRVGFETGQEDADANLRLLRELQSPDVGLNFDPANVVLYGNGDPIEALEAVAPRVVQCHIKDAVPPSTPGEWGEEVVVGTGVVDWDAFFRVLDAHDFRVDLVLEREAGDNRVGDLRSGVSVVERCCPWVGR